MMGSKLRLIVAASLWHLASPILADDDDHGEEHGRRPKSSSKAPVVEVDPTYKAECSSCHVLYPAWLLPARSWQLIMQDLSNHFGNNAEMDAKTAEAVSKFLVDHAADRGTFKRGRKIAKGIDPNVTPLRFTETKYFLREHHEIDAKVWTRPAIGSKANCLACHPGAEAGHFSEQDIRIPK